MSNKTNPILNKYSINGNSLNAKKDWAASSLAKDEAQVRKFPEPEPVVEKVEPVLVKVETTPVQEPTKQEINLEAPKKLTRKEKAQQANELFTGNKSPVFIYNTLSELIKMCKISDKSIKIEHFVNEAVFEKLSKNNNLQHLLQMQELIKGQKK